MNDCGCGCKSGAIDKPSVIAGIACPHCSSIAFVDECPARIGVTWHHPACPLMQPGGAALVSGLLPQIDGFDFSDGEERIFAGTYSLPDDAVTSMSDETEIVSAGMHGVSVGDCDWTHPWDCITSAWDAIKTIPGIGKLAEWGEDFAGTAVGKAFFAIVSPTILSGLLTNAPLIGQSMVVALANPVVLNALPGLARGERVDKAFVASALMVAKRIANSSGGGDAAASVMQPYLDKAMPYVTDALAAAGTSPAILEAENTAARIAAGLRTAEDQLPPEVQAKIDEKVNGYLAKIPDVHTLAQRAGVPDDVMQLALFGATRAMALDPATKLFDGKGNLPVAYTSSQAISNFVQANAKAQAEQQALPILRVMSLEGNTAQDVVAYALSNPPGVSATALRVLTSVPAVLDLAGRAGIKLAAVQESHLASMFNAINNPAAPVAMTAPSDPLAGISLAQWVDHYAMGLNG